MCFCYCLHFLQPPEVVVASAIHFVCLKQPPNNALEPIKKWGEVTCHRWCREGWSLDPTVMELQKHVVIGVQLVQVGAWWWEERYAVLYPKYKRGGLIVTKIQKTAFMASFVFTVIYNQLLYLVVLICDLLAELLRSMEEPSSVQTSSIASPPPLQGFWTSRQERASCSVSEQMLTTLTHHHVCYPVQTIIYEVGCLNPVYIWEGNVSVIFLTAQAGSTRISCPSLPQHHLVNWQ